MIAHLNGEFETVDYLQNRSVRIYDNVEEEEYPLHWHNAIEIIYICAYKAERFVNKQYVGVSVESREDIIQYVAGQIKDLIENYLDKIDEKRVDFWAYMNKSIQYTASRAYQTEVKDGASEYIRHRYDMMSKYLDEGLTLEEIAEKCN